MSTTSKSPAERARGAALRRAVPATALLLAAIAAPAAAERPLPARTVLEARPASALATAPQPRRVRIVGAQMMSLEGADRRLQAFLPSRSDDPGSDRIIAVQVAEPFIGETRTASPVIVIDGQPLETYVSADARQVYARLPARARSAGSGAVQVGWLGDLERTISEPARLSPR